MSTSPVSSLGRLNASSIQHDAPDALGALERLVRRRPRLGALLRLRAREACQLAGEVAQVAEDVRERIVDFGRDTGLRRASRRTPSGRATASLRSDLAAFGDVPYHRDDPRRAIELELQG